MEDERCLETLSICLRAIEKARGRRDEELLTDVLNGKPPSRESVDQLAARFRLSPDGVDEVLNVLRMTLPDAEELAVEEIWVGPVLFSPQRQGWIARLSRLTSLALAKEMYDLLTGKPAPPREASASESLRQIVEAAGAPSKVVENLRHSIADRIDEATREAEMEIAAETRTAIVDAVLLRVAPLLLEEPEDR